MILITMTTQRCFALCADAAICFEISVISPIERGGPVAGWTDDIISAVGKIGIARDEIKWHVQTEGL